MRDAMNQNHLITGKGDYLSGQAGMSIILIYAMNQNHLITGKGICQGDSGIIMRDVML